MSPLKPHNHFMQKYFDSFNNYCIQKTKESQSYVFHPKLCLTSFRTNRVFYIRLEKKWITFIFHSIPLFFLNCLLQLLCLPFWLSLPVQYSGIHSAPGNGAHGDRSRLWLAFPVRCFSRGSCRARVKHMVEPGVKPWPFALPLGRTI